MSGKSAPESPTDDVEARNSQAKIRQDIEERVSGQSEEEDLDSSYALSIKRKAKEAEDDSVAATLKQLQEEIRQLRQERQVREREIAELALAPQKSQREPAFNAIPSTKFPENFSSGKDSVPEAEPPPRAEMTGKLLLLPA